MTFDIKLRATDEEIAARFRTLATRAEVAELLEIPESYLRRILYARREPHNYREFSIRKRRGGIRKISVPPTDLRILQAKLNHVFQLVYRKKREAQGFVRGRGILSNAALHVGKRWVLNVDLADFFPSINFGRVRGMLMAPPYSVGRAAATVLSQICCSAEGLPQGAPSSPMLSNMVCGRLDGELGALARRHHATVSRYADDISFSLRQHDFPAELAYAPLGWIGSNVVIGSALQHVIESNGFTLNPEKSRLQLAYCRQEVTGIGVNVFPNVSRSLVREARAMLHAWDKFGELAAEREFLRRFDTQNRRAGSATPSFRRVLKGKLDYIQMVRGRSDPVYVKLRAKLHSLDPTFVGFAPAALPRSGRSLPGVGTDPGWTRWYQRLAQSVFHLDIVSEAGVNAGTAFAYRRRQLATAAHNMVGDVRLQLASELAPIASWDLHERYRTAGVDCALIHFEHGVPPLSVHPHLPRPGEPIAVIGFASVPQRQPSLGIYPGTVESVNTSYYGTEIIQITVPAAGGLSGSPVINSAGQLIGVVIESTFEQTEIGVPSREYCSVLPAAHLSAVHR